MAVRRNTDQGSGIRDHPLCRTALRRDLSTATVSFPASCLRPVRGVGSGPEPPCRSPGGRRFGDLTLSGSRSCSPPRPLVQSTQFTSLTRRFSWPVRPSARRQATRRGRFARGRGSSLRARGGHLSAPLHPLPPPSSHESSALKPRHHRHLGDPGGGHLCGRRMTRTSSRPPAVDTDAWNWCSSSVGPSAAPSRPEQL
jgi:hypothetical protein